MMKQVSLFAVSGIVLIALFITFGGATSGITTSRAFAQQATQPAAAATAAEGEIPANAKALELDKPITEGLDPSTSVRFYTFTGKANQLFRVSVEPQTGNFHIMVTVLTENLEGILGGTLGETIVSSSFVIRLPADGKYAVTVEYSDLAQGAPTAGSYSVTLSEVKPK
jgi:hypothetical protein